VIDASERTLHGDRMVLQSLCGTVQISGQRPDPGCLLGQPMPKARRRCRPPRSGTGS
jgi:hypothetical protein